MNLKIKEATSSVTSADIDHLLDITILSRHQLSVEITQGESQIIDLSKLNKPELLDMLIDLGTLVSWNVNKSEFDWVGDLIIKDTRCILLRSGDEVRVIVNLRELDSLTNLISTAICAS